VDRSARSHPGDAVLEREDDCLHAVSYAELRQDAGDVGLDGRLLDDELPGDLGIGQATGQQARTSTSRALSAVSRGEGAARRVDCSMSRRVLAGASSASPITMVLMAATS
jgi:hypothetical protein